MAMDLQKALGTAILRRREAIMVGDRKMTQEQLVEEAAKRGSNLDQSGISKIENGQQWPAPANLSAIASALGVPASMLFEEAEKITGELISREALDVARAWQLLPPDKRQAFKTLVSGVPSTTLVE